MLSTVDMTDGDSRGVKEALSPGQDNADAKGPTLTGGLEEVDAADALKEPLKLNADSSSSQQPSPMSEKELRQAERRARLERLAAPSTMPEGPSRSSGAKPSSGQPSTVVPNGRSDHPPKHRVGPSVLQQAPSNKRARLSDGPSDTASGESRSGFTSTNPVARSMVTGSAARVPTQLIPPKNGPPSSSPFTDSGLRLPLMKGNGMPAKMFAKPAIDLTSDGSDEDVEITGSRKAEQEVELDRRRTNSPVCLGVINGVIMCMYGLPQSLQYDGTAKAESVPQHPAFQRQNWASISHFWSQPGYRPILLSFSNRPGPEGQPITDLAVSTILPPLMVNAIARQRAEKEGKPPPPPSNSSTMQPSFGALGEKYRRALLPLLNRGDIRCEARCKLVNSARGALFLHPIEILIFTEHNRMGTVTSQLLREGCALEQPTMYEATDYPDHPRLIVQSQALPSTSGMTQSSFYRHDANPALFTGGYGGQIVQTKEQTEEERKRQVDSVYASLRSGDDLEEVDANAVVTTKLFPHQKQALAFLLDRERERSFEVTEKKEGADHASSQDEEPVSLWRPRRRAGSGRIVSYTNVVTNGETSRAPEICRGAILADDMGLGKTITTIALIANTWNEAQAFGKTKPIEASGKSGGPAPSLKNGKTQIIDEEEDGAFSSGLPGAPTAKHATNRKAKDAGSSKAQIKKDEAEKVRLSNLRTRSRATLIVLPLTLVSSWEEQIKEHWHNKYLPKRLIYHGHKRSQDPIWIANHDIVFTTYPTLANEFSRQKVWVSEVDAGEDAQDDPEGSFDDDVVPLDSNGVPEYPAKSGKKATKRRRSGPMVESKNPLQRIEWFRIVLDEAHTIKEARTWQSKAVCNLSAQRRLCLTGTPVQNRMDDLFSLIKFLRLEPFNDRAIWNEFCGAKDHKGSLRAASKDQNNAPLDSTALRRVQTIMKFLTLRRSKEGKRKDGTRLLNLPPKYNRTMMLEFTEHERAVYNDMHQMFKEEIEALRKTDAVKHSYATILHEISNLRMSCDHFALVDDSKDRKRKKDGIGRYGVVDAIKRDGLTRQRALELFKLFADEDHALCSTCGVDLTHVDAETGQISTFAAVTKCQHLFCTPCFREKAGSTWPKGAKAEQKITCPACDIVLAPLTECLQLAPAEIQEDPDEPIQEDEGESVSSIGGLHDDSSAGRGSTRKKPVFGADADIPIQERPDLSTKIQALLADITPFSQCNPASMLYDESAPVLDHKATAPKEEGGEKGVRPNNEPVVVVQHPPLKAGGPANIAPIKSVVFSQWTKMLDRVSLALERAGIRAARLDGTMPRDRRAEEIARFKEDPSVEVFLVSLKVGGTGLNLVQACRAYILEPYWNPAAENQGLDRVHRMGQIRPVITTKFVVAQSIEERMLAVQKHKLELARSVGDHGERRRAGGDLAMLLDEMSKS